jgi:hypothetical protein
MEYLVKGKTGDEFIADVICYNKNGEIIGVSDDGCFWSISEIESIDEISENRIWPLEPVAVIDETPEYHENLEVGQYWWHPEHGTEWIVKEPKNYGIFELECTKPKQGLWHLGKKRPLSLTGLKDAGYIIGRHPSNR